MRDYFLNFYPHAESELVKADVSPPNLYMTVRVPAEDFATIQGLNGRFIQSDGRVVERKATTIDENWQGTDVVSAKWSGALHVPQSGAYTLVGDGNLSVEVDGEPWNARFLGSGLHSLRVTQTDCQMELLARLRWAPPDQALAVVAPKHFFRTQVPAQGLTGHYYANEKWEGEPVFTQHAPFLVLFWSPSESLVAPFSVRFVGSLRITKPGEYAFWVRSDDGARLTLDSRVLGEALAPYQGNSFTARAQLSAGVHPIELDYFQMGGANFLEFFWQPPGEQMQTVPPLVLIPESP